MDFDKKNKGSIYLPTGNLIIKLDANTGEIDKSFGNKVY